MFRLKFPGRNHETTKFGMVVKDEMLGTDAKDAKP